MYEQSQPPIISFVGLSDSGKTTFLERLIPELRRLGLRVGIVKHDVHGFEMDREGKDTWRFDQAGVDSYAISGPDKLAFVRKAPGEMPLAELASRYFSECDVLLSEGYKKEAFPKIEVYRLASGRPPLCRPDELIAFVSDGEAPTGVPGFALDDAAGVAALISERL